MTSVVIVDDHSIFRSGLRADLDPAIEVYVRDHGTGFDPDAVPDGRLGIRESIVGRMSRAGGTATVTSDESGTEVQLQLGRGSRA